MWLLLSDLIWSQWNIVSLEAEKRTEELTVLLPPASGDSSLKYLISS